MKRIIYILLAHILFSLNAIGNHIMLDKANECYHNRNYKQAAIWYQQMIDEGFQNAELYYNAGNAYFRNAQIGLAIKNYRLSLIEKSNPLTYDNLIIARRSVANPIPVSNALTSRIRTFFEQSNVNTWTIGSIFFFIGLIVWIILKSLNRVYKNMWGILLGITYITSTIGMITTYYYQVKSYPMVVIDPKIEFSSLNNRRKQYLYDGTEVHYVDKKGNNTLIKLPNGEQGWVRSKSLARCN